jgi:hypothetical protein
VWSPHYPSPCFAKSGISRRPINPVPPMINVVMCALPFANGVADVLAKA